MNTHAHRPKVATKRDAEQYAAGAWATARGRAALVNTSATVAIFPTAPPISTGAPESPAAPSTADPLISGDDGGEEVVGAGAEGVVVAVGENQVGGGVDWDVEGEGEGGGGAAPPDMDGAADGVEGEGG